MEKAPQKMYFLKKSEYWLTAICPFPYIFPPLLKGCIYFFEREKERVSGGGAKEDGAEENLKQTLC